MAEKGELLEGVQLTHRGHIGQIYYVEEEKEYWATCPDLAKGQVINSHEGPLDLLEGFKLWVDYYYECQEEYDRLAKESTK